MKLILLKPLLYLLCTFTAIISSTSYARYYEHYDQNNYERSRYNKVTLYQHCGFEGRRDFFPVSDVYSLSHSRVGNDKLSSIIIPKGLAVIVYEHHKFGGRSYRFDHDVHCLPKFWNDRVSSLRVIQADRYSDNYYDRNNYNHNNYNHNNYGQSDNRYHQEHPSHYPYYERPRPTRPHNSVNRCVPYTVTAYGGMGGFRTTNNTKDFKRLNNRPYQGKLCGKKHVEVELSKTQPGVTTVLQINGQKYVFAAHQRHDRLKNNWYRKYYNINLGKPTYSSHRW